MRPLKLVLKCHLRVFNGAALPCCLLAADWSSVRYSSGGINQMTVFEIVITVLHCLLDCVLVCYARSCKCCCELVLCLASSTHVTCAQYRMISRCRDNRRVADFAIDTVISPNWYEHIPIVQYSSCIEREFKLWMLYTGTWWHTRCTLCVVRWYVRTLYTGTWWHTWCTLCVLWGGMYARCTQVHGDTLDVHRVCCEVVCTHTVHRYMVTHLMYTGCVARWYVRTLYTGTWWHTWCTLCVLRGGMYAHCTQVPGDTLDVHWVCCEVVCTHTVHRYMVTTWCTLGVLRGGMYAHCTQVHGDTLDGCWPQQHCENSTPQWWPRPVPCLPDTPRT